MPKPKRAPSVLPRKRKKTLTPKEKLAAEKARLERFVLEDREPSGRKRRKPKSRGNRSGESKGRKRRSGVRPSRRTPSSVAAAQEVMAQVERAVKEQMSVLSARNIRFRSRGNDPVVLLWNPILTPGRRGRPPGKGHSNAKGILSYSDAPKLSELRSFLDAKGLRRGVPAVYLGQALASRPQLCSGIGVGDASAPAYRESIQSTTRFSGLGLMARMFQDRRLLMAGVAQSSANAGVLSPPAGFSESESESESENENEMSEEEEGASSSSEEEGMHFAGPSAAGELTPALVKALTHWRAEVAATNARVHKAKRAAVARAAKGKKPSSRSGARPRHAPRAPCLCAPTENVWCGAKGRAAQPLWLTLRGAGNTGNASSCFACSQCLLQKDVQVVDGWSERSESRGSASGAVRDAVMNAAACSRRFELRKTAREASHVREIVSRLAAWSGRVYRVGSARTTPPPPKPLKTKKFTVLSVASELTSNRHQKSCARAICLLNHALYPELHEATALPSGLLLRVPSAWPMPLSNFSADIDTAKWIELFGRVEKKLGGGGSAAGGGGKGGGKKRGNNGAKRTGAGSRGGGVTKTCLSCRRGLKKAHFSSGEWLNQTHFSSGEWPKALQVSCGFILPLTFSCANPAHNLTCSPSCMST